MQTGFLGENPNKYLGISKLLARIQEKLCDSKIHGKPRQSIITTAIQTEMQKKTKNSQ
jgi:hypothetical protein